MSAACIQRNAHRVPLARRLFVFTLRPLMPSPSALRLFAMAAFLGLPIAAFAAEISSADGKSGELKGPDRVAQPKLAQASDEPLKAMKKFQIPAGFTVSPWASEPLLGNPVAFTIDEKGRI